MASNGVSVESKTEVTFFRSKGWKTHIYKPTYLHKHRHTKTQTHTAEAERTCVSGEQNGQKKTWKSTQEAGER